MRMIVTLLVGLLVAPLAAFAGSSPTEILLIGTIHGAHAKNPSFPYSRLYGMVRDWKPDYVGVEIRPEDMSRDDEYLKNNYPTEMIEIAHEYGERAFGFDWLGEEVAGRPVPANWWTEGSVIKRLQAEMDGDPSFTSIPWLTEIDQKKAEIAMTESPAGINDGRYDALTAEGLAIEARLAKGTRFQPVEDFYAERDRQISRNVAQAIKRHEGSKFVILTGADHRQALVSALRAEFGDKVKIVPVRD